MSEFPRRQTCGLLERISGNENEFLQKNLSFPINDEQGVEQIRASEKASNE